MAQLVVFSSMKNLALPVADIDGSGMAENSPPVETTVELSHSLVLVPSYSPTHS